MKKFIFSIIVILTSMIFFTVGFAKKKPADPCTKKCKIEENNCLKKAKKIANPADRKAENIKCNSTAKDCKNVCTADRNKPKSNAENKVENK